ncbi:MAG: ABC transporter ATP-binding protein [Lachnospiraceae bacterium]|nr:ABC transporter ATP-binding protein [Lachnospiraceae bacterium]
MSEFVKVSNLVKNYGSLCAVDNLSFSVNEGEIFGLLGPNGAGKSTTINILTTLSEYDGGSVTIGGFDSVKKREAMKKLIGIVPQDIALHPFLTAYENVCFFASLYGLSGKQLKEAALLALEFVGLSDKASVRMNRMSGGMKRRLNIACGIAHSPKLIVMDEPTVGVDAQSRDLILHSIQVLRKQGATVIYTSHYMQEVEEICDRIAIVDKGRMIACGTEKELVTFVTDRKQYEAEVKLLQGFDKTAFYKEILSLPDIKDVMLTDSEGKTVLRVDTGLEFDNLMQLMLVVQKNHIHIKAINSRVPSLDSMFLTLTGHDMQTNTGL